MSDMDLLEMLLVVAGSCVLLLSAALVWTLYMLEEARRRLRHLARGALLARDHAGRPLRERL